MGDIFLNIKLQTYVKPEEEKLIRNSAKEANLSISSYLKFTALNKKFITTQDMEVIDELRRARSDIGKYIGALKLHVSSTTSADITQKELRKLLKNADLAKNEILKTLNKISKEIVNDH